MLLCFQHEEREAEVVREVGALDDGLRGLGCLVVLVCILFTAGAVVVRVNDVYVFGRLRCARRVFCFKVPITERLDDAVDFMGLSGEVEALEEDAQQLCELSAGEVQVLCVVCDNFVRDTVLLADDVS